MKENNPDTISQKYFNCVVAPSYKFEIIYAEHLNEETVEFDHCHPYFEIYYVMKGRLKSSINSDVHTLYSGDLAFVAPNIKHYTIYEPGTTRDYFAIIFQLSETANKHLFPAEYEMLREEIQEQLDLIQRNKYMITRKKFDALNILEDIKREMKEKKVGYSSIVNALYHHFFIYAIRTLTPARSKFKEPPENLNLGLEASKYIHHNYNREITLQSVADYLNISPRHVNRVFYEMFGTTFSKALTLLRFSYAKRYLCTTNYSIEKISEMVGFKSPRILYKLFQENDGVTIAEYRESHRKPRAIGFKNQNGA